MGKYTDTHALRLRALHYFSPHAALMHHFDDYFDIWDRFEALWRQSYGPPIENIEHIEHLLGEMALIRAECKGLYNQLRVDPSAIHPIQKLPPTNHIKKAQRRPNTTKKEAQGRKKT